MGYFASLRMPATNAPAASANAAAIATVRLSPPSGPALEPVPAVGGRGEGVASDASGSAMTAQAMRSLPAAEIGADAGALWLVSGVRTATDIMRGEECEILGVCAAEGTEAAAGWVMVLPGTHAKHVRIEGGAMVGFRTYLTGELADVLARHSLLRVSVRWPLPGETPDPVSPAGEAFAAGVREARESDLGAALFRVRTRTVLGGVDPGVNGWFLSGLVIGAEIRELALEAAGPPILLAGAPRFSALYERAFRTLGVGERLRIVPAGTVELAVVRAHARLREHALAGRVS